MAIDIQGWGLKWASRLAGSAILNRLGLRKPAEKIAYASTRTGFQLAGALLKQQAKKKSKAATGDNSKALFDLTLSEEQAMIRDTVHSYASDVLRNLASDANELMAPPQDYFTNLMDLGLNFFSVPEQMGGAAQSYSPLTSAIIAEELAWGDMGLACAALAPVAVANAIVRWGTDTQKELYLPRYLADTPVQAAIAVQEPHALFSANTLSCKAEKHKKGFVLNGSKHMVPLAAMNTPAKPNEDGLYLVAASYKNQPTLFLVPANSSGLSITSKPAMGLRAASLGELTLDNVRLDKHARLGDGSFDYQTFIDLGQLHWCALAIGSCKAALDYLIPYVNEREAFGEPISHRQSVAFMIANIGIELESMRLLAWRAAALAEQGRPFHREAYLAHLLCSEKAMEIGTHSVQLLGGHGFTKEHPAERWYRDLRALSCITSGLHL